MSGEPAVTAMETTKTEEMNHNSGKTNLNDPEETDMELQILAAMRSRVTYLRNGADCFTLVSVRRLLEEDMRLEKFALDVHKSFVKKHLVQCLEEAGNDGGSESSQETEREDDVSEEHEAKNDEKTRAKDTKDKRMREALVSDIRRALRKRASYIKANAERITMALLRRLLEKDLRLEKDSLDPFRRFINKELDEVLQISDAPKRSTKPTEKSIKSKDKSTPSKNVGSEEDSDSDSDAEEEVAAKKTMTRKRELSKAEKTGKRKCENGEPVSGEKKAKHRETDTGNETKETAATGVHGKRVEHLKSLIKSCGMSAPPAIYRKANKAPVEKREATLIEEFEQILAKEGLSTDPSEKEIEEVKKRKDISKELEGIDTSNIVSSSRRRSTTSFAPPPKRKITSESESDEPEDSENGEDNEEGNEEEDDVAEESE